MNDIPWACMGKIKHAYQILTGKPQTKRPLETYKHRSKEHSGFIRSKN